MIRPGKCRYVAAAQRAARMSSPMAFAQAVDAAFTMSRIQNTSTTSLNGA